MAGSRSGIDEELTCLCCGEKVKSLKRHLQTAHQLTPEGYIAAFDLKSDYPLVAPAYAAKRSALAKSFGLGRKPGEQAAAKKANLRGRLAKKAGVAACLAVCLNSFVEREAAIEPPPLTGVSMPLDV